jgi:DNA polymerase III sliding clamp (beta) subunit (PCNA family)
MSLEVNVDKDVFLKAITKASCALGSKNGEDDRAKNFGIEVKNGEMSIIANRMEVSARATIRKEDGLEVIGDGRAVLDGYNLLNNVGSYHQGVSLNICIEESDDEEYSDGDEGDGSNVSVVISYDKSGGRGRWEHKHFVVDEKHFPVVSFDWDCDHKAKYGASNLVENIAKVSFAASEEDFRLDYNVVLLEFGESGATFFATDGRQLAYVNDPEAKHKVTKHAMIEAKLINQISKKNILDQAQDIDISIADSVDGDVAPKIRFMQSDLTIISNFTDQVKKPPYEKILNFTGLVCRFTLDVKQVKEDLKALSPIDSKETLWHFKQNKIFVQNTTFQGKQTSGEIDGVEGFEGEDCQMKFSLRYWENLLHKSGADGKITIEVKAMNIPIVVKVEEEPCVYTFCIQPIKDISL